jgi:dienelactone hydrolase
MGTFEVPGTQGEVVFHYQAPEARAAVGVLLVVPGYNGSGEAMVRGWSKFAGRVGLVVLAPTFRTSPEELKKRKGYYYPDQWSGAVVEKALAEVAAREKVPVDKILIFGHSAGAHFAHRFAIWKPERVRAFVAYSAAWWDDPTEALVNVPALVMCGEEDPRFDATREFMEKAVGLGLPWIWRSYSGTGHGMTPSVRRMAEAFLAHYAADGPKSNVSSPRSEAADAAAGSVPTLDVGPGTSDREAFIGDMQTFRFVPESEAEEIPEALRVRLPSRELAEVWAREE